MASPDNERFFDLISAAMPAAWGAAADVPKNVQNKTLPGVMAEPSAE